MLLCQGLALHLSGRIEATYVSVQKSDRYNKPSRETWKHGLSTFAPDTDETALSKHVKSTFLPLNS